MKTAPLFKEFFRKTANKRAEIAYTFVMSLIFVRTILIFITLLFIMRLMGKRQIGEMQPYELVITLIIADLACIPMADPSVPLLYGLVAILAIYLMHQIVCLCDLKSKTMKRILSGSPSIVLNKNGIDITQLKKNNLDVSDLIESLRGAGYFSLDAVITRCTKRTARFRHCRSRTMKNCSPLYPSSSSTKGNSKKKTCF